MFKTKPENYGRECVLALLNTVECRCPRFFKPLRKKDLPFIERMETSFDYYRGIKTVIRLNNGETWVFNGRKL